MARDHDKPGSSRFSDVVLRRIGPLKREPLTVTKPEWAEEAPGRTVIHNPPGPVPHWQKPFTPLPNVRYTRSPDPQPREAAPAPSPLDSFEAMAALIDNGYRFAEAESSAAPVSEPEAPIFPPNVRFTRSPDLLTLKKSRTGQTMPQSRLAELSLPDEDQQERVLAPFDLGSAHLPDTLYWDTLAQLDALLPDGQAIETAEAVEETAEEAVIDAPVPVDGGPRGRTVFSNDNAPIPMPELMEDEEFGLQAPAMAMLAAQLAQRAPAPSPRSPVLPIPPASAAVEDFDDMDDEPAPAPIAAVPVVVTRRSAPILETAPALRPPAPALPSVAARPLHKPSAPRAAMGYELPPIELLAEPLLPTEPSFSPETLEQNARLLEGILEDFGIRGEIIDVRPGPVVTLYELEPAAGIKSSRVIGLADDIARSMSALSARVAVIPGRNVIGIELPNAKREMVYFRELIGSQDFEKSKFKLALALGKTIGGEPVIAQLEKMPHLLVAGTTGSGKSVAINTMILSLLYRLKPEECRLIMVDPKMLELSIYDGIPHLLSPVVTDPKKAVLALKWAVREMEERYKKMSKLGVRNIDGYNTRAASARETGEVVTMQVQIGFDKATGKPTHEMQEMDLSPMPYIVVIVDEMADLMMVAGKDIEGAIQRLAQMARAAGIHLIMATQRPSVDVITGTIKANFPTRISFQVTSKIDSRTILGEQGAEQLLGQGDMLHMVGGGRIARVHGPFVSDEEVEKVVAHLKAQGRPDYLEAITADEEGASEEGEAEMDTAVFDKSAMGSEDAGDKDLYDQALKVVLRDKKCSTSYIQRRLQIGYNKAASLVERMEKEGLVGAANHAGKREILVYSRDFAKGYQGSRDMDEDEE